MSTEEGGLWKNGVYNLYKRLASAGLKKTDLPLFTHFTVDGADRAHEVHMIIDQYGTGESHAFLQLEADGRDSGGAARWNVATETQKRTPVMRTSAQVFRRIFSQASDVLPAPPLAIEARVVQFKDDTSKP